MAQTAEITILRPYELTIYRNHGAPMVAAYGSSKAARQQVELLRRAPGVTEITYRKRVHGKESKWDTLWRA